MSANLTAYLLSVIDLLLSNDVSFIEFDLFSSFLLKLMSLRGVFTVKLGIFDALCNFPRRTLAICDTLFFLVTPPRDCQMLLGRMHGKISGAIWNRFRSGRPIRQCSPMSDVSSMLTSRATSWKVTGSVAVPALRMPAPFTTVMLTLSRLCILAPKLLARVGEQMLRAAPVSRHADSFFLTLFLLLFSARALPRVTFMFPDQDTYRDQRIQAVSFRRQALHVTLWCQLSQG